MSTVIAHLIKEGNMNLVLSNNGTELIKLQRVCTADTISIFQSEKSNNFVVYL